MNKTLIVFALMGLLLVGSVSGYYCSEQKYSFDDYDYISEWRIPVQQPLKTMITKTEYNQIFQDYRDGIITQQDASNKLKSSKW